MFEVPKNTTNKGDIEHYLKAWELLHEYRQKYLPQTMTKDETIHHGIEVHANPIAADVYIEHIKSLLGGMGFKITYNSNTELIYIE